MIVRQRRQEWVARQAVASFRCKDTTMMVELSQKAIYGWKRDIDGTLEDSLIQQSLQYDDGNGMK